MTERSNNTKIWFVIWLSGINSMTWLAAIDKISNGSYKERKEILSSLLIMSFSHSFISLLSVFYKFYNIRVDITRLCVDKH